MAADIVATCHVCGEPIGRAWWLVTVTSAEGKRFRLFGCDEHAGQVCRWFADHLDNGRISIPPGEPRQR